MPWKSLVSPLLLLLIAAVYAQVGWHEFVVYDDPLYVTKNPHVLAGLTWDGVRWAFTTLHSSNWHPLTWLSLMLNTEIHGPWAGGYALTNVALHAASTWLLYLWLQQMTGAVARSALVAALFAIHPLHVESVVWVSERKDVLSIFFGMAALWAYGRYARTPGIRWYAAVLMLYTLSLLSKQTLVTLPAVLLLLDIWPLRRWQLFPGETSQTANAGKAPSPASRKGAKPKERTPADRDSSQEEAVPFPRMSLGRLLAEKLPLLALAVVFSVAIFRAQRVGGSVAELDYLPLWVRFGNAILVYVLYLGKTFWPFGLAVFYPHPGESLSIPAVIAAGVLLVAITLGVVWQAKRRPYVLVGCLWYLGTLVPVIGLVQVGAQQMADRYTYFPHVGLFMGLTWLVADLLPHRIRAEGGAAFAASAMVLVLALIAWVQVSLWQNSMTLFDHTARVTERNFLARFNLGNAWYDTGRPDLAEEHFRAAVSWMPREAKLRYNLGKALAEQFKLHEARAEFEATIALQPDHSPALTDLGNVLRMQGELDRAIECFRRSLHFEPNDATTHNSLGVALASQRKFDEAQAAYEEALRIWPSYPEALFNMAAVLANTGRLEESLPYFEKSLAADPGNPDTHFYYAKVLQQLGRTANAAEHLRRTLQLNPQHPAAATELRALRTEPGTESPTAPAN